MRALFMIISSYLIGMGAWTFARGSELPPGHSDFYPHSPIIKDFKYPNFPEEGMGPVETRAMIPAEGETLGGFHQLLPFILPSPNQGEAGSCLYMALTGIAEWWLSRTYPDVSRASDGPLDLSERFLMNAAGRSEEENRVPNWKTDSIFLYNKLEKGLLNRYFPFAKGYFLAEKGQDLQVADPSTPGAQYGTSINWIPTPSPATHGFVPLPRFHREILFADPASNQWNTGVAPKNIGEMVKNFLKTYQAPVLVIYNHYGYWHANFIVGYDDQRPHECPFVRDFFSYMLKKAEDYRRLARKLPGSGRNPGSQLPDYAAMAEKYQTYGQKALESYQQAGGCSGKGVFYVRDSLYRDPAGDIYDYDSRRSGEEEPYTKKVILREYEWLTHLGNHMVGVLPSYPQ